jgi:E3 ubiquitin-protein ligase BRE1
MLSEQVNNLSTQLEAQGEVLRKLEEKDRLLSAQVVTLEKESHVKQQALDAHRRKAVESAQAAADLKLHLEKYHTQVKEAQQMLAEKTGALEQEAFRYRPITLTSKISLELSLARVA